jgi:hypothetical protein
MPPTSAARRRSHDVGPDRRPTTLYTARRFQHWVLTFSWDGGTHVLWKPSTCRSMRGRFHVWAHARDEARAPFARDGFETLVDTFLADVDAVWLAKMIARYTHGERHEA